LHLNISKEIVETDKYVGNEFMKDIIDFSINYKNEKEQEKNKNEIIIEKLKEINKE
jgi:hypothetical protein